MTYFLYQLCVLLSSFAIATKLNLPHLASLAWWSGCGEKKLIWEGFEGMWFTFRLESVVKSLAWGQYNCLWRAAGILLSGTKHRLAYLQTLNFSTLIGSLHFSQSAVWYKKGRIKLVLSPRLACMQHTETSSHTWLGWRCWKQCGPSTRAGVGSQGLGSLRLDTCHRAESRPNLERPINLSSHKPRLFSC